MKSVESKFKSVPSKSGLPFFLCCLIIACCSVTTAWAQVSRQEIKENVKEKKEKKRIKKK